MILTIDEPNFIITAVCIIAGLAAVVIGITILYGLLCFLKWVAVSIDIYYKNKSKKAYFDTREPNKNLHKYDGVKDYLDNKKDRIN